MLIHSHGVKIYALAIPGVKRNEAVCSLLYME